MKLEQLTGQDEEGLDSFYISFGDLMVILCVFFVMLLSMSKVDVGSFERLRSVMTGSTDDTLVELAESLRVIVEESPGVPGASVELAKDGVRVNLDTAALFAPGSAVIKSRALDSLEPLLDEIHQTDYQVDIEGHSDDVPYYRVIDGETETNWSLSGKRASSVILHLLSMGFSSQRLRAVGYADTRPVVDVTGISGAALAEARARNRRVSLLIR
ncbi:OmpA/MotB family protein [Microbulbifer rhizosphaerae]|uniref:Chemotaxis protein MotB n=1 Tax=Microbulbifer rhizosphaerae TaxID=1562603 RepID=A0A7W4Z8Y1_9GAMM|nr:OmpA family protein [Microbulbifer rhizosphaerae]MBB3061273.1 chemotaxis protein MotB [Microbulbifer rhizosphaerae]